MKRIALLLCKDLDSRKGLVNAFISRYKALCACSEYEIDVYNILFRRVELNLANLISKRWRNSNIEVDGCTFKIIIHIEYYSSNKFLQNLIEKLNKYSNNTYWGKKWIKTFSNYFNKYDLLSVHSRECAYIAENVKKEYNIPYVATWHGSDIHTVPYVFSEERIPIINSIENADYNFFVSSALLEESKKLTVKANKCVLYNGIDRTFFKYSDTKRNDLRHKYDIVNKRVISFAGTLRDIKNAILLPDIFKKISENCNEDITFWIIGNGSDFNEIRKKLTFTYIDCKLWGNVPKELMPDLLNCTDVLILPSKNEGLPLICIEALACGSNVVGSNVGGIPEAIGLDYCVDFGERFIESFAEKVVQIIRKTPKQKVDFNKFSWENTAIKENQIYKEILYK